jgi:hypothetical protein
MSAATGGSAPNAENFPIAPLIRFTLLTLYLALVLPLPLLAPAGLRAWLWLAVPLGLLLVAAMLSEQVSLDAQGIRVGHPPWCSWLLRRGWQLRWEEIRGLVPVRTSQGGTVYYVKGPERCSYLLPQRVARFPDFLARFELARGLPTAEIGRLTPPWTYWTLATLSVMLLAGELAGFLLAQLAPAA